MPSITYKELRDNLLLTLAHYQNWEIAQPHRKDDAKDNESFGQMENLRKIEQQILYIDQLTLPRNNSNKKRYDLLQTYLKSLFKWTHSDFGVLSFSRLKNVCSAFKDAPYGEEFDLASIESHFQLNYFNLENNNWRANFLGLYLLNAVKRDLEKSNAEGTIFLDAVKKKITTYANTTSGINIHNLYNELANASLNDQEKAILDKTFKAKDVATYATEDQTVASQVPAEPQASLA